MTAPTLLLSVGDPSGDWIAGQLVDALRIAWPSLRLYANGGPQLKAKGVTMITDITGYSSIGFIEPLFNSLPLLTAFYRLKRWIKRHRPTVLVTIDAQGFHLPLIKFAHLQGIKTAYYVAPQFWQWGKRGQAEALVRSTDRLLCLFHEEYAFYRQLTDRAVWVGHPIIDSISPQQKCPSTGMRRLGLFPGSRPQEIRDVAPRLLQAAKQCQDRYDQPLAISLSIQQPRFYQPIINQVHALGLAHVKVHTGPTSALLPMLDLSLVTSGTISLEHALHHIPCVVAYRLPLLSFWLAKRLVWDQFKANIGYISLPNMIAKKAIIPEYIQNEAQPETMATAALALLNEPTYYQQTCQELAKTEARLGGGQAG